jgi:signal transduction histidine kinase
MRSGKRSVRVKVFLLLLVPLVSVIALWAFAAGVTVNDARRQVRTNAILNNLVLPFAAVQSQLTPESLLSVVAMGTRLTGDRQALAAQRARTDGALGQLRAKLGSDKVRGATSAAVRQELSDFVQRMSRLAEIRATVNSGTASRLRVISGYADFTDAAAKIQEDIGAASLVDVELFHKTVPLYATGVGVDELSQELAIVVGAVSAGARSLDQAETAAFAQAVYGRRLVLEKLVAARVSPDLGTAMRDVVASSAYATLTLLEDRLVATPPGSPFTVDVRAFQAAGSAVGTAYGTATQPLAQKLADQASSAGRGVVLRLGLAGGLGLVGVVLSLLLSFRFGRRLTRELTGLQGAARDLADRRLPGVIERLRRDEPVNVDVEAPPLEIGETAEVARVGEALTTVQRTAIEAAIGEAKLRGGVRQVFLNLARRSQSLLHRQLTMLDAMERKTSDPDALEELFRLDNLTTRMRRHAEGLIILSGSSPARAWSTPVRVVDVVRAAIAEVESYSRVRVFMLSDVSLQGSVVADVTHLIAELVENAASFSPPHTQVRVRAQTVGNGFAIEIEDGGLGLNREQLADVNDRLARPPDFDLADTDRLGLFVVAQLAIRHGIRVTLRPSPYGGTTAIVLLPPHLMAHEALAGAPDADGRGRARTPNRRRPGSELDAQLAGRHRGVAGFVQRTRELHPPAPPPAEPPPPRQSPEWRSNGQDHGAGNGRDAGQEAARDGGWDRQGAGGGWDHAAADHAAADHAAADHAAADHAAADHAAVDHAAADHGAGGNAASAGAGPAADGDLAGAEWAGTGFDVWASTESAGTSAGTHAGLPRRVRRASLAPQLRESPAPGADELQQGTEAARSPEQARSLMNSLQHGWQRGRTEPDPGARPTEETR